MRVTLTVDGAFHDLDVETGRTLADMLGMECGVSGCRVACTDGTCGVCAVVVDGDTIRSCLMLAVQATGTQISTTGDHRSPNDRRPQVTESASSSDVDLVAPASS